MDLNVISNLFSQLGCDSESILFLTSNIASALLNTPAEHRDRGTDVERNVTTEGNVVVVLPNMTWYPTVDFKFNPDGDPWMASFTELARSICIPWTTLRTSEKTRYET